MNQPSRDDNEAILSNILSSIFFDFFSFLIFFSTNKRLSEIYVAGSEIKSMCNEGVIQAVESTLQL